MDGGANVPAVTAIGTGGLEGAERTTRETALWSPFMGTPDAAINRAKELADARTVDLTRNDPHISGAINSYRDSIVGSWYRLNATPDWRRLGASEGWAVDFVREVESLFYLAGETNRNWLDVQRRKTFTDMIRLAVAMYFTRGEVAASAEWVDEDRMRPFKTAVQFVSPDRISNPNDIPDTDFLRRGIEKDRRGRIVAVHVRNAHPRERDITELQRVYSWRRVPLATKWGRTQFIYVAQQDDPEQTRGVADITAALKASRMTGTYLDVVLQNAVVEATYAATLESELPPDAAVAAMGGGPEGYRAALMAQLGMLSEYTQNSNGIRLDGVKVPHLYPGTKLNIQAPKGPGGVGEGFESSLLRRVAAALGLSYEEFANDVSDTNYSSMKGGLAKMRRHMNAKKRFVADRVANEIYTLFVEEQIALGNLPLPPGKDRSWFYEPFVREALCLADWIGAGGGGQIDEVKETQAAEARIKAGLSTRAIEAARLGHDWEDVISQLGREKKAMEAAGLNPDEFANIARQPRRESDSQEDSDDDDAD